MNLTIFKGLSVLTLQNSLHCIKQKHRKNLATASSLGALFTGVNATENSISGGSASGMRCLINDNKVKSQYLN